MNSPHNMRLEHDLLGQMPVPHNALYGIHTLRAVKNFPASQPFPLEWYKAVGSVKQAVYQTIVRFVQAVEASGQKLPEALRLPSTEQLVALIQAASEVGEGEHFSHFLVPAIQGGAGTSINMNVNEIIANRALCIMGHNPGDHRMLDPVAHANVFQSTNDVIPTALRVALLRQLSGLENSINRMRFTIEQIERENRDVARIGYTQMQQAVPSSFGLLFSTYSDALSRDWWRVSKCAERLKTVNLGGGAIGTGLAVPRFLVMESVQELRNITGLPLARAENLADNTANLDALVEEHAIMKAHAVTLEKMASDIRLLASDFVWPRTLEIPPVQTGSSIMPGKINPVVCEYAIAVAHRVYANDQLVSTLCGQGCLDLNAYLPIVGCHLLDSISLLIAANHTMEENLLAGLRINRQNAWEQVLKSPSVTTALVPYIGYHAASQLALTMKELGCDVFTAIEHIRCVEIALAQRVITLENLLKKGFSIHDL